MDRQAATKQMKALKAKAKAARKEGKRGLAAAFKSGSARLQRKLKATGPRGAKRNEKKEEAAAAPAAPAAQG